MGNQDSSADLVKWASEENATIVQRIARIEKRSPATPRIPRPRQAKHPRRLAQCEESPCMTVQA